MLKIFKNYASKTSLLDDFMYYENRQKILQEEKARLLIKSYGTPVFVPVLHPPRKLNNFFGLASSGDEIPSKNNDTDTSNSNVSNVANNENRQAVDGKPTEDDVLRFRSLAISPERIETKSLESDFTGGGTATTSVSTEPGSVLTVGSMPVKVNGFGESSGFVTVGTIPLDPKALKVHEGGGVSTDLTRLGTQKG